MLIALHKYYAALALILVGFFAVCAISDGFDGAQAQIEMQANAEFDTDDFDDDGTDDFCISRPTTSQHTTNTLNCNVLCGKEQTAAKRSSVQMSGLTHSLAPNKGNNSASYYSEFKGGVDCGSHHLFLYQFINLKFSHNEKVFFNCVFGAGFRTKRVFG
ncbi:MAG: hypothetical protein J6T98_02875 [Salinivirgaceae bacterium]|nr:hypothetical protein [Salinivirgaceae bacterium]